MTIYLEDPKLDTRHLHIFCKKIGPLNQFIARDVSDHKKCASGVWVQLMSNEVDLFTYDYFDREFSILNGSYKFEFKKTPNMEIDEYYCWLKQKNLFDKNGILKLIGISGFEDFQDFDIGKLEEFGMQQEQRQYIADCIKAEL